MLFFRFLYTGYTLLPSNTINRYLLLPLLLLLLLLVFDPLHLDARGARTKVPSTLFPFLSSVFWKIIAAATTTTTTPPSSSFPHPLPQTGSSSLAPSNPPQPFFFFSSLRREEKVRAISSHEITRTFDKKYVAPIPYPLPSSSPFPHSSPSALVLPTYVYLVAKNIRECR